jgi:hypothetical protein
VLSAGVLSGALFRLRRTGAMTFIVGCVANAEAPLLVYYATQRGAGSQNAVPWANLWPTVKQP